MIRRIFLYQLSPIAITTKNASKVTEMAQPQNNSAYGKVSLIYLKQN
jgi:hypothetical protein